MRAGIECEYSSIACSELVSAAVDCTSLVEFGADRHRQDKQRRSAASSRRERSNRQHAAAHRTASQAAEAQPRRHEACKKQPCWRGLATTCNGKRSAGYAMRCNSSMWRRAGCTETGMLQPPCLFHQVRCVLAPVEVVALEPLLRRVVVLGPVPTRVLTQSTGYSTVAPHRCARHSMLLSIYRQAHNIRRPRPRH
jgi:hypothetical protein